MTTPGGGGPFQTGDDFVTMRLSMDIPGEAATGLRTLRQEVDQLRTSTEAAWRSDDQFTRYLEAMATAADRAAAKKAVCLAARVAERAGVQRLRVNLVVDAQWLTWANSVIGGGKAAALRKAAHAEGIALSVSWISQTENPADAFTVCRGIGPRFLRWQDGIDQIEVVDLLSQAGARTGGAR